MRIPLPVLAASLMVLAAGVVILNVTLPNRPTGLFINASALQQGQNITLHLDYVPMNITIATSANTPMTALCMYYHGILIDQYGEPWANAYTNYFGSGGTVVTKFNSAVDIKDTNVTVLVVAAGWNYMCPPSAPSTSSTATSTTTSTPMMNISR